MQLMPSMPVIPEKDRCPNCWWSALWAVICGRTAVPSAPAQLVGGRHCHPGELFRVLRVGSRGSFPRWRRFIRVSPQQGGFHLLGVGFRRHEAGRGVPASQYCFGLWRGGGDHLSRGKQKFVKNSRKQVFMRIFRALTPKLSDGLGFSQGFGFHWAYLEAAWTPREVLTFLPCWFQFPPKYKVKQWVLSNYPPPSGDANGLLAGSGGRAVVVQPATPRAAAAGPAGKQRLGAPHLVQACRPCAGPHRTF